MTILPWKVGALSSSSKNAIDQAAAISSSNAPGMLRELFTGLYGGAKFSAYALIAWQLLSVSTQLYREHEAQRFIHQAKQEQTWLVGQQLAPWRRIGAVSAGPLGHIPYLQMREDQLVQKQHSVWGMDLIGPFSFLTDRLSTALTGSSWVDQSPAIHVSVKKVDDVFPMPDEFVYRHEEAHAQFQEHKIKASPPTLLPALVSIPLSQLINTTEFVSQTPAPTTAVLNSWRSDWMATIYSESFADAFAILTAGRKSETDMKHEAQKIHAYRLFAETNTASSTLMAGSSHATESAAFIAGQLDAKLLAQLDAKGLLELSSKIASDALAWTIARQAPLIGFFSEEGQQWWKTSAQQLHIPPGDALKAWDLWKTESSHPEPLAAFGSFHYDVQGHLFFAKGLRTPIAPTQAPQPAKLHLSWQYDGQGGQFVYTPYADSSIKNTPQVLVGINEQMDLDFSKVNPKADHTAQKLITRSALLGAMESHLQLSEILGTPRTVRATELAQANPELLSLAQELSHSRHNASPPTTSPSKPKQKMAP